jgi:hypothetical protein
VLLSCQPYVVRRMLHMPSFTHASSSSSLCHLNSPATRSRAPSRHIYLSFMLHQKIHYTSQKQLTRGRITSPKMNNLMLSLSCFVFLLVTPFWMKSSTAFSLGACPFGPFLGGSSKNDIRSRKSQLSMIFGPPKDDGKPGDYVCKVCTPKKALK